MRTLNLGILAHVDAGKTSLTERLLFEAGVIPKLGSVDDGSTQTDSLELEKQRGITIRSAVAAFTIGRTSVYLVDTPGHPDFIAEVERALGVLDAAIVVVSAVEGVQAQTRILVRALRRLNVPFVFFINKVDRRGADYEAAVTAIVDQMNAPTVAMSSVSQAGSAAASVAARDFAEERHRQELIDVLAESDDALFNAFVLSPGKLTDAHLHQELIEQVGRCQIHPAFAGSARTGSGVRALMTAIETILPAREPDARTPVRGRVFKIDRGWGGEKLAFVSLTSGTIHVRETVELPRGKERITGIQAIVPGKLITTNELVAGQIGLISGLASAAVGDTLGQDLEAAVDHRFAPPTLETAVLARHPADRRMLWSALCQLAEQDPLINLRYDEHGEQMFISLYGEVQKEVIAATLEQQFGLTADFLESTVLCIERLILEGEALEVAFKNGNPWVATIGLSVAPRPPGSGNSFAFAVNSGVMPTGFYRAVEAAVGNALKQGMYGWPVIDCQVTMTVAGQVAPISTATDFRQLSPLVLASAISEAGTIVCEPISRFRIECPPTAVGAVTGLLGTSSAAISSTEVSAGLAVLEGMVPTARLQQIRRQLPDLTAGSSVVEAEFNSYKPVASPISRRRVGPDPFNRAEYLAALRAM